MSVEGALPARRAAIAPRAGGWIQRVTPAILVVLAGCADASKAYVIAAESAPNAARVALVRLMPCGDNLCETLWIGSTPDSATRISTLPHGEERAGEIAWTRDGKRVAFLINGYQLRIYDAQSLAPAGLVDLVPADARPTSRIARGITFSDNGAAITFDDCPRDRSGCRPGLLAISSQ